MTRFLDYIMIKRNREVSAILAGVLFLWLFASQAWGAAICYVSPLGSNTSPYETWPKAATNCKNARDYIRATGGAGSTIYIAPGTYTSASDIFLLDSVNLQNLTIIGTAAHGSTVAAPLGSYPIINGSGAHIFNVTNGTGLSVNNLDIRPTAGSFAGASFSASADVVTFNHCDLAMPSGATWNLVLNGGITSNFNFCRFFHEYDTTNYRTPVRFLTDADGTFNYCTSMARGGSECTTYWSFEGTSSANINNCIILDSQTHGLSFTGSGAYNVSNSIVIGGLKNSGGYPILRTAGTLTLTNNVIIANPWDGDGQWISGTYTDGGGNILTNIDPKFKTYPRKGYILPRIDDVNPGFTYTQSIETLLAAEGMKGTYFPTQLTWDTANNAALRSLVSGGVIEIGIHSYSHSDLTISGKIFDVTKAAETITIDRTAGTITLSGGGTVSGFKSKTLAAIKTELEALGATVTAAAIYNTGSVTLGKIQSLALGEVIAAGAAVNQIDIYVDTTSAGGYFKAEMVDPKAWMAGTIINGAGNVTDPQTGATYVCRTFAFPFNANVANSRTGVISSGYALAGGGKIGGAGTIADVGWLGDIDLFAIVSVGSTYLAGSNETNTRYNARALAFAAAHTGLVIGLLAHNTTEVSLDQWTWAINEWAAMKDEVVVTSHQIFRDYIVNSGLWTDDGDNTYSRIYTNGSGDYHLRPSSPCINAGTDVGLTTDIEGKTVPYATNPSIGAYEKPFTAPAHR